MAQEILVIIVLILLNGLFSMAEISIVSAKKSRLEELLRRGKKGAKDVIHLASQPNRFLSTVQIGITSIGILTGVFGGATISENLKVLLINTGVSTRFAGDMALAIVVIIITFLSIVVGELLPKRIGLTNPETISLLAAKPMIILSRVTAPFVWLLGVTTDLFIKLLGVKRSKASQVTEEEIKALVEEGTTYGTIEEIEQDIVENVFFIGDLRIDKLMTVRSDVVWLNTSDSNEHNINKILDNAHSVFPVCDSSLDNVLGVVYTKDLFRNIAANEPIDLIASLRKPNFLPFNQKAYKVLERFKSTKMHFGFVLNEYGEVEGIVTINDILDELVGDITYEDEPTIIRREDGSLLMDGKVLFSDMVETLEIDDVEPIQLEYNTIAGFILHEVKEIPKATDKLHWRGFIFEVVDMDGNRIDKVLVYKQPKKRRKNVDTSMLP